MKMLQEEILTGTDLTGTDDKAQLNGFISFLEEQYEVNRHPVQKHMIAALIETARRFGEEYAAYIERSES